MDGAAKRGSLVPAAVAAAATGRAAGGGGGGGAGGSRGGGGAGAGNTGVGALYSAILDFNDNDFVSGCIPYVSDCD
jgi:hypothetical protein